MADDSGSDSSRVEVNLLGQRLLLKRTSDPHHIDKVVGYVRRKIDEAAASADVGGTKLVILAALNIADDYFRNVAESQRFKGDVAARSKKLLAVLDEYLSQ